MQDSSLSTTADVPYKNARLCAMVPLFLPMNSISVRAVGYARLSRSDEGKMEPQIRVITEHCKAKGYKLLSIVEERASAYNKPLVKRKGWNKLIAGAQAYDVLIVRSVDRITRDVYDGVELMRGYRSMPFRIETVVGHWNLDTPEGKLAYMLQLLFAWYESEQISYRTKQGQKKAREKKCTHSEAEMYGDNICLDCGRKIGEKHVS